MSIAVGCFTLKKPVAPLFVISTVILPRRIGNQLISGSCLRGKAYLFLYYLVSRYSVHIPTSIGFKYINFRNMMPLPVKARIIFMIPVITYDFCWIIFAGPGDKGIFSIGIYSLIEAN